MQQACLLVVWRPQAGVRVTVGCRVTDYSQGPTSSPATPFIFCFSLFVVSSSVFVAAGVFVLGWRVGGRCITVAVAVTDKGVGKPTPSPALVHNSS